MVLFRSLFLLWLYLFTVGCAKWKGRFKVYIVSYGQIAFMKCEITGDFIGIFKPNGEQIVNGGRYKITNDTSDSKNLVKQLEIDKVEESDYGDYKCKDSSGENDATLEIQGTIPKPVSPQRAAIGFNSNILGQVYGMPRNRIVWYKIVDSEKVFLAALNADDSIQGDKKRYNVSTSALTIKNVVKSDGGDYMVAVEVESGLTTQNIKLIVGSKPYLRVSPPSVMMQTQDLDLVIPCVWVDATSPPTWTFQSLKGGELKEITDNVDSNAGLTVKAVSAANEGNYTCSAANDFGESSVIVLFSKVITIPTIDADTFNNLTTLQLPSYSMICTASGSPSPTIKISKYREDMQLQMLLSGVGTANLTIAPMDVSKRGEYLCEARNRATKKDGTEIVAVKKLTVDILTYPLIITESTTKSVTSAVGRPMTFQCSAKGNPLPTLKFNFPGGKTFAVTKSTLHGYPLIKVLNENSTKEDFNSVNCTAENSNGKVDFEIKVREIVKASPPIDLKISGTAGLEYLDLQWGPVNGTDNYVIYVNDTLRRLESKSNGISIKSLNRSTYYSFKVASENIAGVGDPSEPVVLRTSSITKPGPTLNFQEEEITTVSATVKWDPPDNVESQDIITYRVKVCQTSNGTVVEPCHSLDEKKDTSAELRDLRKGTLYEVEIVAYNQGMKGEVAKFYVKTKIISVPSRVLPTSKSLDSSAIAGIIIAVILIILVVVDMFCCFFNNCGFTHCCYETFCASKAKRYAPSDVKDEEDLELKPKVEETV